MALIPLNTFKTKTAVLTTLKYNQAKCARDTGLMIDSIAFDLLFGGTTQTAFAAIQYWSQGTTKIPGEVFQTLSALQHAKEVAKKLVVNTTIVKSIGNTVTQVTNLSAGSTAAQDIIDSEFEIIMDIIQNGTAGTTDKIVPNVGNTADSSYLQISDTGIKNAAAILEANKAFLQSEVVAFVNNRFSAGYVYDQAKCSRDTGLIVDSLAFDLLFSGNTQSTYAGVQYWIQDGTTIPNETTQTKAAISYLQTVLDAVVTNTPFTASTGNKIVQVINQQLISSTAAKTKVDTLVTKIHDIIDTGTSGLTDQIEPNGSLTTDTALLNTYTLLQSNKTFVQSEIVAWINVQKATSTTPFSPAFTYDSDKCYRDVSYIMDCVSFDLIYGGNRQTIQAGAYYYGFDVTSSISTNGVAVASGSFVVGTTYVIRTLGTGGSIQDSWNTIAGTSGVVYAIGKSFVARAAGSGSFDGTAFKSDEISESISAYNYMKSLISYIIECQPIAELYQTDVSQVITTDYGTITQTNEVINNIDLITNIIQNGASVAPSPQPISLDQTLDTNAQNAAAMLLANKEFIKAEVIAYINSTTEFKTVADGNFITGKVYTISNLGNTDWNAVAGTSGITYVVEQSFTATTAGTAGGTGTATASAFKYTNNNVYDDTNFCYRDIGYIIECIRFDMLYTGTEQANRQAIQAGVYYFNNSSTSSVVAAEKTDTINAYQYMAIVFENVIKNITLTQTTVRTSTPLYRSNYLSAPYQTTVLQDVFLPTPSSSTTISTSMYTLIDNTMVPIIKNGPSSAPVRVPITIPGSALDAQNIKAYNILMANKDYITAEVIGYMNALTSPNTTKIYTAPPGVTAIVLMAQVSNVTDRNIKITFAHYRNLPVFADPATLNGFQAANTTTEIVKDYLIPPNDAATLIQGKMIIESFDSIVAYATESHGLKVTLSILETANA